MTDRQINEATLRQAWRRHVGTRAVAGGQLADSLRGLQDGASAAEREVSVARLAEDARAADLGRALWALNADARELETGFLALQRRPRRRLARVAFAAAASLALAALLALPQWRGAPREAPLAEAGSDSLIASSSFEAGAKARAAAERGVLFRGGFDS
jgi:hypothetical protein